jgi:hypothetical protein
MLNTVNSIFYKGEFNRHVLTLVTGTGLAQIIPLAITPILARIYSPEQFGVFALFIAVASSLSVVATGRYELAIMLPRKDVDAASKPSSQAPPVSALGRSPCPQCLERVE